MFKKFLPLVCLALLGCDSVIINGVHRYKECTVSVPSNWDYHYVDDREGKMEWVRSYSRDYKIDPNLFFEVGTRAITNDLQAVEKAIDEKLFFQQNIKDKADIKIADKNEIQFQGKYAATEIVYTFYDVDQLQDEETGKPIPKNDSMLGKGKAVIFAHANRLWILDASAYSVKAFESGVQSGDFQYIFDKFRIIESK